MCAEYVYDAWGRIISAANLNGGTVAEINPFRYKSYYYDTETGFYYLQSRYYDPTVARFISADSTDFLGASGSVLSYNLFCYCENEPVLNSDPSGNIALTMSISSAAIISLVCAISITLLLTIFKTISPKKANSTRINQFCKPIIALLRSSISKRINKAKTTLSDAADRVEEAIDSVIDKIKGENYKYDFELHHIVAKTDNRAIFSRIILRTYKININKYPNTVLISKTLHKHIHTSAYHYAVSTALIQANLRPYYRMTPKASVYSTLISIGFALLLADLYINY